MTTSPNDRPVEHRRKLPSVMPGGGAIRRVKNLRRPCALSFGQGLRFVDPHVTRAELGNIVPHTGQSGGTLRPARS